MARTSKQHRKVVPWKALDSVDPVRDDPDIVVVCQLFGTETTLGAAAEKQGTSSACYDCEHRRPCGRLYMVAHSDK
ncbi:MAG: hypothetical protein WBP40_02685 [Candidatus Moraniibacteriota bacterium]